MYVCSHKKLIHTYIVMYVYVCTYVWHHDICIGSYTQDHTYSVYIVTSTI